MRMTHERWQYTNRYAQDVFGAEDGFLIELTREAAEAGLPPIAVSSDVGRLLMILTSMTAGRLALEIGTLGGYSATWIVRGMAEHGRLITIEYQQRHADFAEQQFTKGGFDDRIEVRRGPALELLPGIAADVGPASLDLVFIDAEKTEYPEYFAAVRPLMAPTGLLIADNVFGTGSSWIDDLSDPGARAADELNRAVAADPWFVATGINVRSGLLVARRVAN